MTDKPLDDRTPIRAGPIIGLVVAAISFALWLNNRFNNLEFEIRSTKALIADQWTKTEMELFAVRLQAKNPTVEVPPVRR